MKFESALDELQHWLGLLEVDIRLGVARRHLEAELRLCGLLAEKLASKPYAGKFSEETLMVMSIKLLDLQRQLAPVKPGPKADSVRGPRLRVVS